MASSAPTRRDERLDVRLAFPFRLFTLILVPMAIWAILILLDHRRPWFLIIALALPISAALWQIALIRAQNRPGPVMALDDSGVTVRGYPTVPWSSIDRLTVGPVVSSRNVVRQWFANQFGEVVAFVPKPGVDMPPPPGGVGDPASGAEQRQQRFGSNLTVVTGMMTVSASELIEAAGRWGGLTAARAVTQ